ncbi:MAG: hypothetical protein NUW24_09465 [Anaerolineae bacterium]|jgi:hypothetical protein|nr:hypothetical protein [Anaerolineae bacterium]MDH7474768.1 hypothetical protein [Anaerolineae bacterium]
MKKLFVFLTSLVLVMLPLLTGPQVVSAQQAQNVELVSQIGGLVKAVALQGNYAYVGVGPRLVILNVSDAAHPAVVGQTGVLPGVMEGVVVSGNYAYVAAGDGGLCVINVADPAHPAEAGSYDTPGYAEDVAVSGNYAYVADWDGGLVILRFAPYHVYLPLVLRNH